MEPKLQSALIKELYRRGLTQEEVANIFDISQPAVFKHLREKEKIKNCWDLARIDCDLQGMIETEVEGLISGQVENGSKALFELIEKLKRTEDLKVILKSEEGLTSEQVIDLDDLSGEGRKRTRASDPGRTVRIEPEDLEVPPSVVAEWQEVINLVCEITDVPAGLITQAHSPYIEILCSARTGENPTDAGQRKEFYGMYCEHVIKNKARLLVPNALKDPDWKDNPDIERDLISYLGYPLVWPNGDVFGTLCILDKDENHFGEREEKLLELFKEVVEAHLEEIYRKEKQAVKARR